jgi:hypothetical protein
MSNELERMAAWFLKRCDGDWEHGPGVRIATLDNPGWSLHVNMTDTPMERACMSTTDIDRSKDDWVYCELKEGLFLGRCGPLNLTEMFAIFLAFAEAADKA